MAQQARPKVAGHMLRVRAHFTTSSTLAGDEVVVERLEAVAEVEGHQAATSAGASGSRSSRPSWPTRRTVDVAEVRSALTAGSDRRSC